MDKSLAPVKLFSILDSEMLLLVPPEELGEVNATVAWSVIDGLEKEVLKRRKEGLREYLLELAERKGTVNKNGSYVYAVPDSQGSKVTKERRKGKVSILFDKLWRLFNESPVADRLFRYTCRLSPSQYERFKTLSSGDPLLELVEVSMGFESETSLEGLVKAGEISLEQLQEVTEIGDATFALKVKKPSGVTELLASLKGE